MYESRWFEDVMGIPESQWDFTHIPQGVRDDMGCFETHTVKHLEDNALCMLRPPITRPLIVTVRTAMIREEEFDTSALQVNGPERAMYQVASNFNCLEVGSERTNPFSGYFLTQLMSDSTQGPSAAAGAGAGAILRLVTHHKNPINMLDQIPECKPCNGKLHLSTLALCEESCVLPNYKLIKVGLHTNVRATYDRQRGRFTHHPEGPRIDQVYVSTCICGGSTRTPDGNGKEIQEAFLRAAYYGTYAAAVMRKSTKLVLTAIGGGCFRNDPSIIMRVMAEAHTLYSPYLPPSTEVHFPIYVNHGPLVEQLAEHTTVTIRHVK